MKKHISVFFALSLMTFLLLLSTALADMETVVIPEGTVTIAEQAFMGDTELKTVVVQEGVTAIGEKAFADSGLTEIDLPLSLESLASTAFDGCGDLTVNVPQSSAAAQLVQDIIDSGKANITLNLIIPVLQEGNNTVYAAEGVYTITTFTAAKAGTYTFYSTGSTDTYGHLYNEGGTIDIAKDDGGSDSNFLISQALTAGQTVYLDVKYCQASVSGNMTVVVEFSEEVATVYRALLIGEVNYDGTSASVLQGGETDVSYMSAVLRSVNDGQYKVTSKLDATKAEIKQLISTTFSAATENDVSFFYFSGHGDDYPDDGDYYGALYTPDNQFMKTTELASWLSAIPGKKIVVIDSCGSGASIGKGIVASYDPDAFSRYVISVFAQADAAAASSIANSGEMATNTFYVMTASKGAESSYVGYLQTSQQWISAFTYFFCAGVDTSGTMPADSNSDNALTLNELYEYAAAGVSDLYSDQHPQVYPTDSSYVLFTR